MPTYVAVSAKVSAILYWIAADDGSDRGLWDTTQEDERYSFRRPYALFDQKGNRLIGLVGGDYRLTGLDVQRGKSYQLRECLIVPQVPGLREALHRFLSAPVAEQDQAVEELALTFERALTDVAVLSTSHESSWIKDRDSLGLRDVYLLHAQEPKTFIPHPANWPVYSLETISNQVSGGND